MIDSTTGPILTDELTLQGGVWAWVRGSDRALARCTDNNRQTPLIPSSPALTTVCTDCSATKALLSVLNCGTIAVVYQYFLDSGLYRQQKLRPGRHECRVVCLCGRRPRWTVFRTMPTLAYRMSREHGVRKLRPQRTESCICSISCVSDGHFFVSLCVYPEVFALLNHLSLSPYSYVLQTWGVLRHIFHSV